LSRRAFKRNPEIARANNLRLGYRSCRWGLYRLTTSCIEQEQEQDQEMDKIPRSHLRSINYQLSTINFFIRLARELRSVRAKISAPDFRRSGGANACVADVEKCRRTKPARACVSFCGAARRRQNIDGPNSGEVAQLRKRTDGYALRRVRQ